MERPRIDPRQRFAQRMTEELGFVPVFIAACQLMRHQMVQRGEIGPHDGASISPDDAINWLQWRTLRQLKIIGRIAEGIGNPEEVPIN